MPSSRQTAAAASPATAPPGSPVCVQAGALRLAVEHRAPGADAFAAATGGPTLRLCDAATGREWLRFDCFARGAHWHLDPEGRDEITAFARGGDAIDQTLAALREHGASWLERAGAKDIPAASELERALLAVEPALRNGPVNFDAVDEAVLRQRSGDKWRHYPDDVLPLWVADMDFEVADPIRRRLQCALDAGDFGYPTHPGPTPLPALFAERMQRRFGWRIEPGRVELTSEVVQAIYIAVQQFSKPGEGVIVQRPIYPPFIETLETLGRRLVNNPLKQTERGFELDLDDLRARAREARILLLCNPHNPTGRVYRREELQAIADIAVEHELLVISDEIHADLVYPGAAPHIPIASLSPAVAARTITLNSASKAFNIAGLRCAVVHFGSEALQREFCALPQHLRGGLSASGLLATEAAWRFASPWLDAVLAYLRANRDYACDFVRSELPGLRCFAPEATYLAWLDCREAALEPYPWRFFFERSRVALSNGRLFGPEGDDFVRLNFATSRALLERALERMAKALRAR